MIGLLYGANGAEFTSFLLSHAADSPGMFVQAHPTECLLHGETGGQAKDGDKQRDALGEGEQTDGARSAFLWWISQPLQTPQEQISLKMKRDRHQKCQIRGEEPIKSLECHVTRAHSLWNSIIPSNQPMFLGQIRSFYIPVIYCDDFMVPWWRRGTVVTTFKKGNEREESHPGQTQLLPNQLQTSTRREARAAAEAVEKRDKIISAGRIYSGGFVFFRLEGSVRVSRTETRLPLWANKTSWSHSCVRMEHHAKCPLVCSCSSDVLHQQRRSLRPLHTCCCWPPACVEHSSPALLPSICSHTGLFHRTAVVALEWNSGKSCCPRTCSCWCLCHLSRQNVKSPKYKMAPVCDWYSDRVLPDSTLNDPNKKTKQTPNSSSLIFIFYSFLEWLWQ